MYKDKINTKEVKGTGCQKIAAPEGIMKEKKSKKNKFFTTIRNNAYALRLGFSISKPRVINALFLSAFDYSGWVFFTAIFMRHIVDSLENNRPVEEIYAFIITTGIVFLFINLYVYYVKGVTYPLEDTKLYYGIYRKLYHKAKNVELRCYEDADFYNRYTMAIDNAGEKVTTIIDSVWGILTGVISVSIVFSTMLEIEPLSVLFILSPLLGNFVFGNIKNKYEFRRYQESVPNDKVINYVNRVMYLPDYAKEIRLSRVFDLIRKQYKDATYRNVKIADKYAFRNAHMNFWRITFTFTVIFEGVMLFAAYCTMVRGSMSIAELVVMSSLMVSATWMLIQLCDNIMNTIKNGLFIRNLRDFLEYEECIPEDQKGIKTPDEILELSFEHVSFSYQDEKTIKDLNFTIHKGDKIALVGHNGAGKTTIIKLLLRLYDPTEGVIRLNGIDIREYDLKAYRSLFATAFQDFKLFGMTVKENILMGTHPAFEDELVIDALKKAGVYERVMELPNGIHTMMTKEFDENGAILSGGESQKIAVARAFLKPSPIRIFDEPSSALDPIAEYNLFNSIMKDGEEHTMIFISHRLSSVKNADRVFMLELGQIIEEGTHKTLILQDGKYAEMYKKQAMNYLAVDTVEGVAL